MSRRDAIRMTPAEIEDFLAEPGHTLQLATINADGTPHLVAMAYCVENGKIAMWSYAKSQKVVNLRRDSRLTVMVESGRLYAELRGVQINGIGVLVEDPDEVLRIGETLARSSADGERTPGDVAKTAPKRVGIVVEPKRVISWDHRKLGGRY